MYEKLNGSDFERRQSSEFGSEQLQHIAQRRENLAKVLDINEVRGLPVSELLARGGELFADHGRLGRDDPVPADRCWCFS